MTLGNFHNIQTPRTQIVSGNINNQVLILNIDNSSSSLSPNCSYQVVGDVLNSHQFSAYVEEEEEEEEDEEEHKEKTDLKM